METDYLVIGSGLNVVGTYLDGGRTYAALRQGWAGLEGFDPWSAGNLMQLCERDGVRESYLAPRDHRIAALLTGPLPTGLSCAWRFEDGETEPRQSTAPCDEEVNTQLVIRTPDHNKS